MQKKAIKRETKKFEDDEKRMMNEERRQAEKVELIALEKFDSNNHAPVAGEREVVLGEGDAKRSNYDSFLARENKSFWLPSKTPEVRLCLLDTVLM